MKKITFFLSFLFSILFFQHSYSQSFGPLNADICKVSDFNVDDSFPDITAGPFGGATVFSGAGSQFSISISPTTIVPGQAHTITLTRNVGSGGFSRFLLHVDDASNTSIGTFTTNAQTQHEPFAGCIPGTTLTHINAVTYSASQSFTWTAPTSISGPVSINAIVYQDSGTIFNIPTPLTTGIFSGGDSSVLNESFDNDSGFTKSQNFFNDGTGDYFGIFDPIGNTDDYDTSANSESGFPFFTGNVGNYLIGEDLDGSGTGADNISVTWSNLDITGLTSLSLDAHLAAQVSRWDPGDFIRIEAQIDGGGYNTLTEFISDEGNGAGSSSNELSNGQVTLGTTFQTITSSISGTGSSLDIRISVRSNSTGEEFGIDELKVTGFSPDTTPPVFENSTPSSASITTTGFTLNTDIDEAGTIYYVVVADGATAPTSAEVKAGTASGGNAVVTSGNATVSTGGFTNAFNVTGLTSNTAYDVYVVAEDDEGTPNLQASPTKIDVTTANTAPTFTSSPVTSADEGDTYTYTITTNDADDDAVTVTAPTKPSWLSLVTNPAGDVTTFAGTVSAGSMDGNGTAASFRSPHGVAVDGSGNVYVADAFNHKIRKIAPNGDVTTLAGSGNTGSMDGNGTAASFNFPTGVAVDGSGNVYVADQGNRKIRKIAPNGDVTTLAGSGNTGSMDGNGTAASFNFPNGVAVDGSGNVYVADTDNHNIRKIAPNGDVTTFAGSAGSPGSTDANGTAASFIFPFGIAVDGSDNVYVADRGNHKIRKIAPNGDVTTFAGSGSTGDTDANGTAASFTNPYGVAIDGSGNVYVADTNNNTIRKIAPNGDVTTLAGSAGSPGSMDGNGTAARFNLPFGVAVDGSGNMYVADRNNNNIRKVSTVPSTTLTGDSSGQVGDHNVVLEANDGNGGAVNQNFTITVKGKPIVITNDATNVTTEQAALSGDVTSDGGATVVERGIVFSYTSVNSNPRLGDTNIIFATSITNPTYELRYSPDNLPSNTEFSFVAYARNSVGVGYGEVKTFITNVAPVFENGTPSTADIALTSFTLNTDIDEGGTIYYVVVADGATAPTSAEVKAGTASGGGAVVTSGNATVSTGGFTNAFNVTGLTLNTAYDVYVVAEDDESSPMLQASPTKVDVTTLQDTTPPTVTDVTSTFSNGSYKEGVTIFLLVNFSEAVTVTGTPQLELETGTIDRIVDYAEGSGTSQLTFNYTVQAGDTSSDLDCASANSLTLNGGVIVDEAGNSAILTLPFPGGPNSLGVNKDLVIDTTAPTISTSNPLDDAVSVNDAQNITISFNENIAFGSGNIQVIDVTDGSNSFTIDVTSPGSQASIFDDVLTINPSSLLDRNSNYAIQIDNTAIRDIAGNNFAGITDNTTLNFMTVPPLEVTFTINHPSSATATDGSITANVTGGVPPYSYLWSNGETTQTINNLAPGQYNLVSVIDANAFAAVGPIITLIPPVEISFTNSNSNGLESVSSVNIPIDLSTTSNQTITVDYTITGTATGGSDYTLADGTLTFNPLSTDGNLTIANIVDDAIVETNETVIITLSNPTNATLGANAVYTYTIDNNDTTEVTIVGDVQVDEDAGNAVLTAMLSNPVQGGFFIHVTTSNGTAVAPGDYTAQNDEANTDFSGTAGETQQLLIPITDDSQGETNETFTVTLSSVSGTTLGSSITTTDSAIVTIVDNDAPVVTNVSVPTDGLYGIGSNLDFTVSFTDAVTITGTPRVPITIGSTTVNAELNGAVTNSSTASFRYTITEGELDTDGIVVGTAIDLNGGSIVGTSSTIDAILTLNSVGATSNINVDGIRPTVAITTDAADPTNVAYTATFTFSEDVTGFEVGDITVGNGTASNFNAMSATVYTATITPTADGMVTVDVAANVAEDAATNGNEAAAQYSVLYDATNPTATLSTTAPDPVNTPFTVDIAFDEDVFGFEMADLVVTNGTPSGFAAASATMYSVLVTPTGAGDVVVEIPAGVTEDLATNGNNAASFTIEYDNIPPNPPTVTHISEYTCSGTVAMTSDNTLKISGTAEAQSTVEVFVEAISVGTVVTGDNGFFEFDYTGTTLADGTYNITAQATDVAGNTGDVSSTFTITINTVDSDSDGIADFCDDDDDGNGVDDVDEDCDGDGIIDSQDSDNSACTSGILQVRSYGFSPNGDGVNDGWTIENITAFPNNTVSVFSRSGKLVFKKQGYQNDWTGISNQINNGGINNRLPVGPYIFVIDLGDGSKPTRGWLYINY